MMDGPKVKAARAKIAAACPDVLLETGDYGRALYAYKNDKCWIVIRPERPANPENDFAGQSEVCADIDVLIKEWSA